MIASPYYSENTYVTDEYSIENSVVTSDVFVRLLSEVHNVVDFDPAERDRLIKHFSEQLCVFQTFLRPVMAQILLWRVEGVRANLNNVGLSEMFSFPDGGIVAKAGYETEESRLARVCADVGAPASSRDDIRVAERALDMCGGMPNMLRGKYLVWFLSGLLNSVYQSISEFVAVYVRPPKSKLSVGPNNLMVVAAPRARIPASLRNFIERGYNEFILAYE